MTSRLQNCTYFVSSPVSYLLCSVPPGLFSPSSHQRQKSNEALCLPEGAAPAGDYSALQRNQNAQRLVEATSPLLGSGGDRRGGEGGPVRRGDATDRWDPGRSGRGSETGAPQWSGAPTQRGCRRRRLRLLATTPTRTSHERRSSQLKVSVSSI